MLPLYEHLLWVPTMRLDGFDKILLKEHLTFAVAVTTLRTFVMGADYAARWLRSCITLFSCRTQRTCCCTIPAMLPLYAF